MPLASGTKPINVAMTLLMVAILLDSSLLVSASLPPGRPSRSRSSQAVTSALLATPSGFWAFADGQSFPANMSNRGEIMSFILANPGVYLREISEDLGMPMGVVQYHLWVLAKEGQLEESRSGRYRRFFGAGRYLETERTILSLLRQGTPGRILAALSKGPMTHVQLAAMLGLTSQGLSWQVRRLKDAGVLETVQPLGTRRSYCLTGAACEAVRACMVHMPEARPRMLEIASASRGPAA